MKDLTIGFIGLGLIGGSIAKSLRKNYPGFHMIAYNHHEGENPSLELAKKEGVINQITGSLSEGFSECDLIFLCGPVIRNQSYLPKLSTILKEGSILTDVGSVKGSMHKAVAQYGLEPFFIGGHPMAGKEFTGYQAASDSLLNEAYYVLTPTDKTPKEHLSLMVSLVTSMGANPVVMNPLRHDEATAAISHLPHIASALLVNLVRDNDCNGDIKQLAAGGFRDITRISSSSPVMWQNILMSNAECIQKYIAQIQEKLSEVSDAIASDDEEYLLQFFQQAK
ncbi:MAG: prephenate dehydrogenase/arogenate dehydrogenase family protein, partial [Clostridiales bacterium]|nr:prephenate dehydrogenase/arogenate dehydrogenase family protein [Clostridiales bacterium]